MKAEAGVRKEEYEALLSVFERFLDETDGDGDQWELIEQLSGIRSDFMLHRAFAAYGMDFDKALEIVRSQEKDLTERERADRDVLVAAIDNLIDFSTAAEYHAVNDSLEEMDDMPDEEGEESGDDRDDDRDAILEVFAMYNSRYADVEDLDAAYAMAVASTIVRSNADGLMYMTQGDERVRPWHLQYEGFTATKENFPAWLIPPIEHACRCYLVDADVTASIPVQASVTVPEIPSWFNPTFKESVALGGRIFSDEHPYFEIRRRDRRRLRGIAGRIKDDYMKTDGTGTQRR